MQAFYIALCLRMKTRAKLDAGLVGEGHSFSFELFRVLSSFLNDTPLWPFISLFDVSGKSG